LFAAFPLVLRELVFEDLVYKVFLDGLIEITPYPGYLEAVVPLRMVDPYAYGVTHEITEPGEIEYQGTAVTYPVIEFTGPVTNPSITIGDDTLVWNGTLVAGEKLIIDCDKKTVKKGAANALKDYVGGFPSISGDTEVLTTDSFKLTWVDRYI
jgi:phage-related protein